ncbi:Flp pilus assembly protein CpaB [Paenarthrobacter sp. AR 02]|uniref:Flp pilus assembly protein CpaB n=1 Tax=Paenarthrobacter sp. AR 02 TaxID=2899821 RepID=UPI001F42242E|nr:Flp pilus assembly protein CpaB [Paenarthrobacter sp. AR 02]MCF3137754.1 Flp pilus assembly protein CpaB [Paenarthrobacter sp. AR 02]
MKSRLIGGIAALVLAIIGTVLLVNYVSNADRRAQASLDPVDVVVVEKPVPAGTTVQELSSYIRLRPMPSTAKADGALTSLDLGSGKVTSVALEPGEQLLGSRLINPSERITPGSVPVPEGMQEVTIVLPPESVVGGTLRAGDLVGLFVTLTDPANQQIANTQLVFDKVLVTAVQQAPAPAETTAEGTSAVPSGSSFVTLARNSTDAAKVILSARTGNIWLTKQSATTPEGTKTAVSTNGIFQ